MAITTESFPSKLEPFTLIPGSLEISIGSLKIETVGTAPRTGCGTKIYFDGVEQDNIFSLDLHISVDDAVTATIKRYV